MLGQIYLMSSNNYYYVGKHDGDIFTDKYFGSGIAWKNVLNKYGIENVNRKIICEYNTKEEADLLEKRYISKYKEKYGNRCLNIADGGQGGNLGEEVNKRISIAVSGEKNGMYGKQLSEDSRKKISDSLKSINHKPNKGKTFDESWRQKLSDSHIGKNVGKKHTQEEIAKIKKARAKQTNLTLNNWEGCHWYTDGINSHQYKEGEEPIGWHRGRTIKKKEVC